MKAKSKKVGIIGIALIVFLLAVVIVFDVLCAVFSTPISLFFRSDADSVGAAEATQAANEFTVDQVAGGMVLMKNEGDTLPLPSGTTKVNLFGALSVKQLYLGTGSAGGWNWDSDAFLNLKDALAEEGVSVNEDLWNFYSNLTGDAGASAGSVTDMLGSTHSIVDVPLDYDGYAAARTSAESYSDTAILVVGRAGGEGSDAVMDMTPYESSRGDMNQGGAAGYHYLELMPQELELVNYVKGAFENVVLLVNTPMAMELGFVDGEENADGTGNIDSVLWIGMPGSTGNRAVAQALTGKVVPSGRTADIWAREVESAPTYYNFGDYTYDGTDYKYVHYEEGIYYGYRWYETASAVAAENGGLEITASNYQGVEKTFDFSDYDSVVQYPFGYGLSYSTFEIAFNGQPSYDDGTRTFTFNVNVKNTGDVAARTPVELFVETPYDPDEGIEKAKVTLAAFGKTGVIEPDDTESVTLTVNRDELASYDYATGEAYKLSAGDYTFYADYGKYGSHCWANTSDTNNVLTWTYEGITQDVVFSGNNKRNIDNIAATNVFDDVSVGDGAYTPGEDDMKRSDFAGTFPESYAASAAKNDIDERVLARLNDSIGGATLQGFDAESYSYTGEFSDGTGNYADPTTGYTMPTTGADNGLSLADLVGVPYDDERWDDLLDQMSYSDMCTLTLECGWQNPAVVSIKKPFGVDMDGAEGLHNLVTEIEANCYACAPMTASSFDTELAYDMGAALGDEAIASGVTGLYGFSMNLHRSPFGGRAFEYYSEDPLLSGYICAGATSGIQSKGVSVYSKHFAVNDQETNRGGVCTWLSEQTLREIYLRPFEIVQHNATNESTELLDGMSGVMTSYNRIGTSYTTAHYGLCTTVLRNEWGFNGKLITDAGGGDNNSASLRAGSDMFLGFGAAAGYTQPTGIDPQSAYGMTVLREACKRQLFIFANMAGMYTESGINMAWVAIPIVLSIVLVAVAVVLFIFMVYPAFFKKKEG